MFNHLSLKTKMLGAFSGIAVILLVVGGIGVYGLQEVTQNYDHIVKINFPNSVNLVVIRGLQKDIIIATSTLVGTHSTPAEVAVEKERAEAAVAKIEVASQKYLETPFAPGEEDLWKDLLKAKAPLVEMANKLIALSATGVKSDEAYRDQLAAKEFKTLRKSFLESMKALLEFQTSDAEKWAKIADSAAKSAKHLSLIFMIAGFFSALLTGFLFSRSLSKQLSSIAENMLQSADSVASSSQDVSAAGTQLSASTTEQAAALQQTVASIEEVSAMVQKNAENSNRSQDVSTQSQDAVIKGKKVVESMITAIDDINHSNNDIMTQIEHSNQQISEIVKVIAEIGNKTKVINDIVFQTKLLSFNASVEAARAGEHGKGFAVVAEEVGNLAQMSGNAAKEISQMLEGSIQKVEGIVNETKSKVEKLVVSGKQKVEVGTRTARQCGEVLDAIVKNVSEVTQMVGEIATASQEQSQGVQEINKAMTQMDQVTHQNAAASQQVAGASEQLSGEAQSLRALVQGLMQTVQGSESAAPVQHVQSTAQANNVVRLPARKSADDSRAQAHAKGHSKSSVKHAATPMKKASGAEHLPSHDDSRFEDV